MKQMNSSNQPFVASRQGFGAIIAVLFFSGVFALVSPDGRRLKVANFTSPSTGKSGAKSGASGDGADAETREPASVSSHHLPFAAESSSSDITPALVKTKTGVDAIRVRSAYFFADTIKQHNSSFTLRMNLFPDALLTAEFQAPSVLSTNSNLYVGTIAGDPDGQFRFTIDGDRISGTIRAFHKSYQLIPTAGSSHLIAELKE